MARFNGIRRTLARVTVAVGAAVLLWASTPGMVLPGQGAHAAPALQRSVYAALVGTWLGPGLGDTGRCGTEYGQFTFFRNQEYAYTSNSEDCGGFTMAGYYWMQSGLMYVHWTRCNFPCRAGTSSSWFTFLGANAFQLHDSGGTYVYYRQ